MSTSRPKRPKMPSWRDLMGAVEKYTNGGGVDDLRHIFDRFKGLIPPSNAVIAVLSPAEARGLYMAADEGRRSFDEDGNTASPQQILALRRGIARLATAAGCRNPYPDALETERPESENS